VPQTVSPKPFSEPVVEFRFSQNEAQEQRTKSASDQKFKRCPVEWDQRLADEGKAIEDDFENSALGREIGGRPFVRDQAEDVGCLR